jgi:hypothetical protein
MFEKEIGPNLIDTLTFTGATPCYLTKASQVLSSGSSPSFKRKKVQGVYT